VSAPFIEDDSYETAPYDHFYSESIPQGSLLRFSGTGLSLMNLNLYARVLRRFWWLVVPGVLLAFTLAFLSFVRVSSDGIAYRKPEVWQSQSLLLLTQPGFLWGRTVLPTRADGSIVDPGRLSGLTELYAQFANSDEVRRMVRRKGAPKTWKIVAAPVASKLQGGGALPVIALSGQAGSAKDAAAAVALETRAFIEYMARQQEDAAIPPAQRVYIQVLARSSAPPLLIKPRSKTLPIMVFFAVLAATVGLVFVLENRSPRMQDVEPMAADDDVTSPAVRDVRRWG